MKHCAGCINYDLKQCKIDGMRIKFQGKGCDLFTAHEPRYERYNDADYQEYVKECKMCEQS